MEFELAVIGGGKMGAGILRGLLDSGRSEVLGTLAVVERNELRAEVLRSDFGTHVAVIDTAPKATYYLIATKPSDLPQAVKDAYRANREAVFISIAAGVTLETLHELSSESSTCVRVMPNTAATLQRSISAVAVDDGTTGEVLEFVERLFRSVGDVVFISESKIDLVTAVSGSGPAYLYLLAEALEDAAVSVGLPFELASRLVQQTLVGASHMYLETGKDLRVLKREVTSPGGTTAAALIELERCGLRAAVYDAIRAAIRRAEEIGKKTQL
ncbi:pyrroline-5-carboxylate reductase [Ferrithrix thermotolerans DSM 19514]|uniref:Pyrroline-5-carboxylate reductase n=1 Tax=Ferrithrix thermotolerans DSM 19514 TaxID=1121881 RepID=A0A1M4SNU1_9ACTN|nr:pyrroline-5-carboxylate reductase [Ferrithrix thermotolerans]SHE33913.1 pyrroline-5-carboxylate reductase [Ferrithrix thermotolerans DSM 19514]